MTFVDISSKLALAMIDCEYGKSVSMHHVVVDGPTERHVAVVEITFSEGEP